MAKGKTTNGEKKVKLRLLDRILLTGIIIQRGNKADMIVAKDVMNKIELNQRELKDYDIRFQEGKVFVNSVGAAKTFESEFTELEVEVIKKSFKQADADGNYTQSLIDLEKLFE